MPASTLEPQFELQPEPPLAKIQLQVQLLPQFQLQAQPPAPPPGVAQQTGADGANLTVTVTKVIDPLLDSGASLLPGTRAVGLLVEIANAGPASYDSSATGDFSLIASAGAVTPVFAPNGVCQTPLQDFDNDISAGEDRSGCIAFSVASDAGILAVRFAPHAAASGSVTWAVSP